MVSINILETSEAIIKAGASALAIHGRTKSDYYAGTVNYDLIRQVKERHPDLKMILAPRHLTRTAEVKTLIEKFKDVKF